MFDKKKFTEYLDHHGRRNSIGKCAEFVREALEAAGVDASHHPFYAKDYGAFLEQRGFHIVSSSSLPEAGDIAVIQPTPAGERDGISSAGHVTAYDGHQWVSDFFQRDVWGGRYRKDGLPITIYRHN